MSLWKGKSSRYSLLWLPRTLFLGIESRKSLSKNPKVVEDKKIKTRQTDLLVNIFLNGNMLDGVKRKNYFFFFSMACMVNLVLQCSALLVLNTLRRRYEWRFLKGFPIYTFCEVQFRAWLGFNLLKSHLHQTVCG